MGGIGESLRNTREAKGITLHQAEEDTKIRKRYLEALEEGDYDVIPGRVYARGFLRNYANYLGLDQEEIMIEYKLLSMPVKDEYKKVDIEASINKRRSNGRSDRRAYLATVLIAVLAILILVVYNFVYKHSPKNAVNDLGNPPTQQVDDKKPDSNLTVNPEVNPAINPAANPEANPTANPGANPQSSQPSNGVNGNSSDPGQGTANNEGTPGSAGSTGSGGQTGQIAGGVNITLNDKDQVCWIRVTVDGVVKFTGNINPGESKTFSGAKTVKLRLGNAGAVEATLNGQNLGALGPVGQPVTREFSSGNPSTTGTGANTN